MSEQQIILNDDFWKFLVSLEELRDKKDKILFCSSLGLNDETLKDYIDFLNRFDVLCVSDTDFIYPLKDKCRIKMEFSLSEWLALQASFGGKEDHQNAKHYYQKIIKNKLDVVLRASEQFSLHRKPAEFTMKLSEFDNLKKKFDHMISVKRAVKIHFFSDKECVIFPHRLVFIDGVLCVVGENVQDKMLVYFGLEDIKSSEEYTLCYEANLSQIEINDFIAHSRLINGKEERIVLKIYNQHEADLLPSHHFLGNPFVTSNTEGDMIWAATIEICTDIFQWLYKMKDRVEVLDPGHVKKEFSQYCELKKEASTSKKAC
jgi:hypothetical protein